MLMELWHWLQANDTLMGLLAGGSLFLLVFSVAMLPFAMSLIPADYFAAEDRGMSRFHRLHPVGHAVLMVLKNIVGVIFLIGGLAMLVLPGQGLLTIIVALIMLDFPGKYRLEQRLVRSPRLIRGINWLRRRAGAKPLILPRDVDEED